MGIITTAVVASAVASHSAPAPVKPPVPVSAPTVAAVIDPREPTRVILWNWDRLRYRADGERIVCDYQYVLSYDRQRGIATCDAKGEDKNTRWVAVPDYQIPGYKLKSYSFIYQDDRNTTLGVIAVFAKQP